MQTIREAGRSGRGGLAGVALLGLSLSGCVGFWDEVTSHDFKLEHFWSKPNPFVVLKESNDGDARAKALRAVHEPKQYGGTDQEQDTVLKILVTAAGSEKQFLCRLAAIDSLGRFKDPRAVPGLIEAFNNSKAFAPEQATRIQCEAAGALGRVGGPDAEKFLLVVVRSPQGAGSDQEKQQVMDVRIAAARALGGFKDRSSAEALVRVLQTDKDVALRDCARESLHACTGKEYPRDFKDWDKAVPAGGPGKAADIAEDPAKKRKILGLF